MKNINGGYVSPDSATLMDIKEGKPLPYQYSYVELEEVMKNPEEYIIPACLPACKRFWDKNIETFMVSNLDDASLYVMVDGLSFENMKIFQDLMEVDPRYFYSTTRGVYGIRVPGTSFKDRDMLEVLTGPFQLQDVSSNRYQTSQEFLDSYRRTGGEYYTDPVSFQIGRKVNPDLADVTFETALDLSGKRELYCSSENRVYQSPLFFQWHQRYQRKKQSEHQSYK